MEHFQPIRIVSRSYSLNIFLHTIEVKISKNDLRATFAVHFVQIRNKVFVLSLSFF